MVICIPETLIRYLKFYFFFSIQPSKEVTAALKVLNESLRRQGKSNIKPANLKASVADVAHEWFSIASTESAYSPDVEDYLEAFKNISVPLLQYCVNMKDSNVSVYNANKPLCIKLFMITEQEFSHRLLFIVEIKIDLFPCLYW